MYMEVVGTCQGESAIVDFEITLKCLSGVARKAIMDLENNASLCSSLEAAGDEQAEILYSVYRMFDPHGIAEREREEDLDDDSPEELINSYETEQVAIDGLCDGTAKVVVSQGEITCGNWFLHSTSISDIATAIAALHESYPKLADFDLEKVSHSWKLAPPKNEAG